MEAPRGSLAGNSKGSQPVRYMTRRGQANPDELGTITG